jgi:hypothetical protein
MTQENPYILAQQKHQKKHHHIEKICDNLLDRMLQFFEQDLIFEDPKELVKIEALLKIRSKLLDFDRDIRQEYEKYFSESEQEKNNNREALINSIIEKINQSVNK